MPLKERASQIRGWDSQKLIRRISGEFKHSWGTAEKLYKSEAPRRGDVSHSGIFWGEPGAFLIKKIDMAAI